MSKPKSKKNVAKNVETKPKAKPETIETMSESKLAMALNQNYSQILQAQQAIRQAEQNIGAINKEFERRQKKEEANG